MVGRVVVAVPESAAGTRADRFVADAAGLSRSYVQRLITEGRLTSGGAAIKANAVLRAGDELELDVPEVRPLELEAEAIPLTVVYEDADLLIIDKPAGLVVHPGAGPCRAARSSMRCSPETAASAASPVSPDRASSIGSTVTRAG